MAFVLDASVTLAWYFSGESTPYTSGILDRLSETVAVAPIVWPLEVANALLVGERRGRLTEDQTRRIVETLRSLPITIDEQSPIEVWTSTLVLARAQGVSVYDASYLDLAVRQGLPLATLDARLSGAASRLGVPLMMVADS